MRSGGSFREARSDIRGARLRRGIRAFDESRARAEGFGLRDLAGKPRAKQAVPAARD